MLSTGCFIHTCTILLVDKQNNMCFLEIYIIYLQIYLIYDNPTKECLNKIYKIFTCVYFGGGVIVFNATFKIISVILVEETREPGENDRPAASH